MVSNKLWNIHFIRLLVVATLINTSSFILIALLPLFMIELGGNNMTAGTLMMIMTISAMLFRPLMGNLVDAQGRQKVLIFGVLSFAMTTFLLTFSAGIIFVYILRFFQGIGLSAFTTSMGTILSDVIPDKRLAEGVGYFGVTGTLASAFGPVTALFLLDLIGYEMTFMVSGLVALVSGYFAFRLNYEKRQNRSMEELRSDTQSQAIEDSSVISVEVDRPDHENIGIFSFIEKTSIRPCIVVFFVILPISSVFSFMTLYALERGIDNIGLFFTVYSTAMVITRIFGGKLTARFGYFKVFMPSIFFTVIMFVLLSVAQSLLPVLIAAVLYGIGFGTVQPILNTLILQLSPADRKGAANATYYATMDLAFGLGSFLWGVVSQFLGFGQVFALCAVMVAIATMLYIYVLHLPLKKQQRSEMPDVTM